MVTKTSSTAPSWYGGVFVIILVASLLRLIGLNKGIWLDEASSIHLISRPDFLTNLRQYDHPPLYFVLLQGWSYINNSESFLRLLSVILNLGMVIMIIGWLKFYSNNASLMGGFLGATMPIMLEYAHEIRNYALLLWGVVIAFYFAEQILRQPNKLVYYGGLTISLTIVIATHLVGVLLLPTLLIFMVIRYVMLIRFPTTSQLQNSRYLALKTQILSWASILRLLITFAIPGITFLVIFFVFLPSHLQNRTVGSWWMPSASIPQLLKTAKYVSGLPSLVGEVSLSNTLLTPMGIGFMILGLILFAPLLVGDWRQSLPMLIAALTYWAGLLFISMVMAPIFIPRTTLPGLIPLIGFISLQIATIPQSSFSLPIYNPSWRQKLLWFPLSGIILMSLVTITHWIRQEAWTPVERWQPIAEALAEHNQSNDLVVFYPGYNEAPIRYYYADATPLDSTISIWIGGTPEKLGFLQQLVSMIATQADSPTIYLILRDDQNVANEQHIYTAIHDLLQINIGPPITLAQEGNISLYKYEKQE